MRYILVDRILHVVHGQFARGCKNVTQTDEIFDHHFPDLPIMPGCMILEALAQLSGLLAAASQDFRVMPVLLMVEKTKFRRLVRPGDQLVLDTRALILTGEAGRFETQAKIAAVPAGASSDAVRLPLAVKAVITLGLLPIAAERQAVIRRKFELLRGDPYEGFARAFP
jgi:3-hydroxyacyl-[acyl-carrier-protein] dehydratase